MGCVPLQLCVSRLDHRLPREKAKPGMMEGPADVPYQIADVHLP